MLHILYDSGWQSTILVMGAKSPWIICFAAFGRCLMDLNLGIAWATWGAVGTIVTPIAGYFFYRQRLTKTGVVGLILIVVSTITLNLFG